MEAKRTLVKSPPELWAEVSDVAALARHLGELGGRHTSLVRVWCQREHDPVAQDRADRVGGSRDGEEDEREPQRCREAEHGNGHAPHRRGGDNRNALPANP